MATIEEKKKVLRALIDRSSEEEIDIILAALEEVMVGLEKEINDKCDAIDAASTEIIGED